MPLLEKIRDAAESGFLEELLKRVEGEKSFCRVLASYLGAESEAVLNGVEADLYDGLDAAEVKLYPKRFYEGFGQALALKVIGGVEKPLLLHVVWSADPLYLENLKKMGAAAGVKVAVYVRGGPLYEYG